MSLKLELETWASAIKAYDEENFEESLRIFESIAESSKILTNMGLIYATVGEHETAVQHFRDAVGLDRYLAVAYFQCGVSNFLLGRYEEAYQDFNEAWIFLRGNQAINYEQLGLKFRLYSAEVLFNKGLCHIYIGRLDNGLQDMREAQLAKVTEEHGVIDDAIQDQGEGYTVFSIPVGVLYRPSESKLKNAKTKDYLGKAQLIAASDANDAFTTFTGVTRLQQGLTPSGAPITDGRPLPLRSRATTTAARFETTLAPPAPELPRPTTPTLQKSATIGPGIVVRKPDEAPGLGVARPGLARNASAAAGLSRGPSIAAISRNTSASGSGGSANGSGTAPPPVRGLTVRRPGTAGSTQSRPGTAGSTQSRPGTAGSTQSQQGPPRLPSVRTGGESLITPERSPEPLKSAGRSPRDGPRMTDFYDDYIGAYEDPAPPPMPDNVATWAAQTKGAPPPPQNPRSRAPSIAQRGGYDRAYERGYERGYDERSRPPASSYGGSSMGLRRKMSRRPTIGYEDEEEGYVSGDYSDMPFELTKIRVKLHYRDDVRGMAISPEMRFEEFVEKVSAKFGRQVGALALKFKDEDGVKVSMRDDSDYDLAIETARESAKGRPEGKLEIWCADE